MLSDVKKELYTEVIGSTGGKKKRSNKSISKKLEKCSQGCNFLHTFSLDTMQQYGMLFGPQRS